MEKMMIQTDTLNEFPVFDSVKNGKAGGLPDGPVVKVAQMVKNLPAIQETQVWTLGQEDTLEKEMATHSSNFAWRTPWTEEHDGL